MNDRTIYKPELKKLLNNPHSETMRRWMRDGKIPPPDVKMSQRTLGWRLSTLHAAGIVVDPASQQTPEASAS